MSDTDNLGAVGSVQTSGSGDSNVFVSESLDEAVRGGVKSAAALSDLKDLGEFSVKSVAVYGFAHDGGAHAANAASNGSLNSSAHNSARGMVVEVGPQKSFEKSTGPTVDMSFMDEMANRVVDLNVQATKTIVAWSIVKGIGTDTRAMLQAQ